MFSAPPSQHVISCLPDNSFHHFSTGIHLCAIFFYLSCSFLKYLFISLKCYREMEIYRKRARSCIHCSLPQMDTTTREEPDRSLEPGVPPRSSTWVQGYKTLDHLFVTSPGSLTGSWIRSQTAELKPVPLWETGIVGGSLTCLTVPVSFLKSLKTIFLVNNDFHPHTN